MATEPKRIFLTEDEMPKTWYNLRADMKNKPAPMLHPGTHKPLTLEEMTPIFCEELCKQELDNDTRYIDIPEEPVRFVFDRQPGSIKYLYKVCSSQNKCREAKSIGGKIESLVDCIISLSESFIQKS